MYRALLYLLLLLCLSPVLPAAEAQPQQLLVFAAASLTDALQELGADYQKTAHVAVKLSFDASSTLARQIEAGARADVFFSADTDWMDYLQKRNLIQPDEYPYVVGFKARDGTMRTYDSGNVPELLRRAQGLVRYDERRREQAELWARGRYVGLGVA